MATVGEQLSRDGMTNDDLIRVYLDAEESLLRVIERSGGSSAFLKYRVEQFRAIDAILVRLGAKTRAWTSREIAKLVKAGGKETADQMRGFGETQYSFQFSGVNEPAVNILTAKAALEFGRTMSLMGSDAKRMLLDQAALQKDIIAGVVAGDSVARTQNKLIDQFKRQGVTAMRTRNGFGRRANVEPYTNMLVRTQSMTAYNLGARDAMLSAGRRFAVFPTIRPDIDGEDICNEWERKKYVDLLKDPLPPASTHPNCRHRVLPVSFEELKADRPDLYRLALAHWRTTG
jgi:hypothetical protein